MPTMTRSLPHQDSDIKREAREKDDAQAIETIASWLDDPLPADWRVRLSIEAQEECLAATACAAAETVMDALGVAAALRHVKAAACAYTDAVLDLDGARQRYIRNTQRNNADEIIFTAVEHLAGPEVATAIEGALELVRAIRHEEQLSSLGARPDCSCGE